MNLHPCEIQDLAHRHEIKHSQVCRLFNRGLCSFTCQCTFFDEVRKAFEEEGGESIHEAAKLEAQDLIARGFYQTSGKYRGVARLPDPVAGNLFFEAAWTDAGEHRTLTPAVFAAFKALGGGPFCAATELARLHAQAGRGIYADLTFRVALPSGADPEKLFDSIKSLWPDSELRNVEVVS